MKILVTGAGGFIGSHLVAELARAGHRVVALDLRPPSEEVLEAWSPWAGRVEPRRGDVLGDGLEEALRGCEAVAHLAARVGDWGPARDFLRVNAGGTRRLLGLAERAGARRFVLVSSVAVHAYRGLLGSDETRPRDGRTGYGRSKQEAEDAVRASPLEAVVVRPAVFPFGPRDRTSFLPLARALARGMGGVVSGGRARLSTAYVENLVLGLRLCLERPEAAGRTFVIADATSPEGPFPSWRELLDRFADALGVPRPRLDVPFPLAWTAALGMEAAWTLARRRAAPPLTRYRVELAGRDCAFHARRAAELLGYRPSVGLDEAVRRTAAWARPLL